MSQLTNGQKSALRQILLNFAEDDQSTSSQTIESILGVLDCEDDRQTMRDKIAEKAMATLIEKCGDDQTPEELAERAYRMADAMMEARK